MQQVYDIKAEPRGDLYKSLVEFCAVRSRILLLVLRDVEWLTDSARSLFQRLEPFLLSKQKATEWPGTRLTEGQATVFRYRTAPELVRLIQDATEGLYEWQQPERPEDLAFLRSDETPLLVTISHESDAYLELSEDEHYDMIHALPLLSVSKHLDVRKLKESEATTGNER